MTAKSIWIELDSLHSSILLRGVRDGIMPNLARLMARSGATRVNYEIPLQVAAWATAHTGLSVADHGATAFDQPIPGTYRMRIQPRPVKPGSTYWEVLGRSGKRVLVVNSVNAIHTPGVNGIQLNEWATHVAGRRAKATSYPSEIAASLDREFPDDPFAEKDCGSDKYADADRLGNSISASLANKSKAFANLIDREDWDHVHIGIDDLHNLGHVLWRCFEKNDPGNAMVRRALTDADAAVGVFLNRAGPDTAAIVLLLGGIGPANTWSHMVDKIIARFENGGSRERNLYSTLGHVWAAQPPWLENKLLPLKSYLREFYLETKRRRRRAFAMPLNEETGTIRINLRGREPHGVVEPGKEAKALKEDLREALLGLRDVDSNIPLVTEVQFSRDLVPEAVDSLSMPDMFITWNRTKRMDAVQSERLGRIEMGFWPPRTGDHQVDGLVLTNRPIAHGRSSRDGVSVFDLAPTIAALHGVACHKKWRGTALAGLSQSMAGETVAV
ncbi:alkaline phosphatase family protein [Methyloceanibacter sp.]|uniref:alkaline phosphatase family protein n=1 Tax=Methyloceanibacter sp. TaxID=1965321 RepID=UPI003D6D1C99